MPTAWTSYQSGNASRSSQNADSPYYDNAAQSALATIPQGGDSLALGAYVLALDLARFPVSGTLTAITATTGSMTVDLSVVGNCSLYATTITAGTAGAAFIAVTGTAPTITLTVIGNVTGGTAAGTPGISQGSTGTVAVTGNVTAGASTASVGINQSFGTVTVSGVVTASANAVGITNGSVSGAITVGAVVAAAQHGLDSSSTGAITVNGNVTGGTASAKRGISAPAGSSIVVNNGTITGGSAATAYGIIIATTGTITLNNCKLVGGSHVTAYAVFSGTGAVTFNGVQMETGTALPYVGLIPTWTPIGTDYVKWGSSYFYPASHYSGRILTIPPGVGM